MAFKSPKAVVETMCTSGSVKTGLPTVSQITLGFLAGAFVAVGGLLAIVVGKGSSGLAESNPGLAQFVFAAVFPVGLILVVMSGAELFTGNCGVITPACLAGQARWSGLLRNWSLVYLGNFVGSIFVALFLAYWTGIVDGGSLGEAVAAVAKAKVCMSFWQLLLRGIGCNWLVCLAVWIASAAEDIASKILAIWFPIMAFVALGFEHSIANMFFIPLGMFNGADVSIGQFLISNLLPVTIGNIIGGAGLVGVIYWWLYKNAFQRLPA